MLNRINPDNPLFLPKTEQEFGAVAAHVAESLFNKLPLPITIEQEDILDITATLAGFAGGYDEYLQHLEENPVFDVEPSAYLDILHTAIEHDAQSNIIEAHVDGYRSTLYVNGSSQLESQVGSKDGRQRFLDLVNSASSFALADLVSEKQAKCHYEYRGASFEITISIMEQLGDIDAIMTNINAVEKHEIRDFDDIGITDMTSIEKLVGLQSGLVLMAGPRGSGKTETMKAFAHALRSRDESLGNSVFESSSSICDATWEIDRLIRNAMVTESDAIIMPEIRSLKDLKDALKASEAGYLVITTVTQNSIKSVLHALNMMCEDHDDAKAIRAALARQLKGIVAQRLIRKSCEKCQGEGCVHCNSYGNVGHTAVSEIATFDDMYQVFSAAMCAAKDQNWVSLFDDALCKFKQGLITQDNMEYHFGESFTYWIKAQY